VVVDTVRIAPRRVRLPDFHQRLRDRTPILVQHAAVKDDALPDRLATVLARQVSVRAAQAGVRKNRSGQL
jgi:hypothetical protein